MDPGWASQPVTCGRLFKSAAWRDARWIHPRVFRSATLGPRRARARAAACIAMQRSQHKTSCHTWGDRQPTPGYSRTSARFEHSDRDEEKGGRPGGRAEREREREDSEEGFSRGRARNRREKREREREGRGGRKSGPRWNRRSTGRKGRRGRRRKKSGELVQRRVIHGYTRAPRPCS